MMRTVIYGGSFNPIHNGHTHRATCLCNQGYTQEVWFMVSPCNPLKAHANDLLDETARLEMVRLATRHDPRLLACDFEFTLPRPSYTVDTLRSLRETYPQRDFCLIIGADNWLTFHRWREPQEILRHHTILVYPRPGYPIAADRLPAGVTLVQTPLLDISSTCIRHRLAQGQDVGAYLHPDVARHIAQQGYYHHIHG